MKDKIIPLMRPTLAPWKDVAERFQRVYESGSLTLGKYTRELEKQTARRFQVSDVVALSSCTSGLILAMQAMKLEGEVICPSFTWASTGLAAVWNNIRPVFADCTPGTYTVDPEHVKSLITPKTSAVIAVNVFGLYPDMDALKEICAEADLRFISDSAQGAGATYKGRVGGGLADVEVFSMSPTKVLTAMEGGLVTTNDAKLAGAVRQMRDYGKSPSGRDIELLGLSARMSEFHAVTGLSNLERLDTLLARRLAIFDRYYRGLSEIAGLKFQTIPEGYTSSGNYLVVFLDTDRYDRELLMDRLEALGIATKRYFEPPMHLQKAFAEFSTGCKLPVTELASKSALALPIYTHMDLSDVDYVCGILREELSRF